MPDTDAGGKAVDSPATGGDDQALSTTDPSTDAGVKGTTDQGQQAGSQPADTGDKGGTGDTGDKGGEGQTTLPDKDTLPFDQHPKWIAARAAEKRVNEVLETLGFDNIDDLMEAAKERNSLKAVIGNYDPEALVNDFEEFQNVKAYWADQEAARLESQETEKQTIDRLKREKQELLDKDRQDRETQAATEESQRVIKEFDDGIKSAANALPDASDTVKSMLVEFMGTGNEMSMVDPFDPVAVKKARTAVVQRFQKFIGDIEQEAVDRYATGKSKITPITQTDTSAGTKSVSTERKPLPAGTTIDQANQLGKDELLRRLEQAKNA